MKRLLIVAIVLAFSASAYGWMENFDAYPSNTLLDGQGGWVGWGGPGTDTTSLVSNDVAASPENSAKIMLGSDIVQQFAGMTSGQYIASTLTYVPSDSLDSGDHFFIMLNKFDNVGNVFDWSLQIRFDTVNRTVVFDWPGAGETRPLITDQWVPLQVNIDLDLNQCWAYYDGAFLGTHTRWWDPNASPPSQQAIEAIDLFSSQSVENKPMYYDDMELDRGQFEVPEPATFTLIGAGLLALLALRRRK